jgi:hypothetical protein
MTVDKRAIENGNQFERDFCARIGGELTPGSGNKWYAKLDVDSGTILWSLKSATTSGGKPAVSYLLSIHEFNEAIEASRGPGSRDIIPGMAIRIGGVLDIVAMRVDDLLEILREPERFRLKTESKGELKARRARTPALLREED